MREGMHTSCLILATFLFRKVFQFQQGQLCMVRLADGGKIELDFEAFEKLVAWKGGFK
jgi:hypothetical protein